LSAEILSRIVENFIDRETRYKRFRFEVSDLRFAKLIWTVSTRCQPRQTRSTL